MAVDDFGLPCKDYQVEQVHLDMLAVITTGEPGRRSFGDVFLELNSKTLIGAVGKIKLSRYELCLLWLLVRSQGRVVSHDVVSYFLYDFLADDDEEDIPLTNCIEVILSRLRKKLSLVSGDVVIENWRGYGFGLSRISDR